jgi:hypothetical protein
VVSKAEYLHIRRQVRARLDFYSHARVYLFASLLLVVIDVLTPGGWWFFWPVLGWGIGVLVHSAVVFGDGWVDAEVEEREVRGYLERHPPRA